MCEFEFHSWRGVLDTTLCDTDYKLLVAGRGFSPGSDSHNITEVLLTVTLSPIASP